MLLCHLTYRSYGDTLQVQDVLDGRIAPFVDAYLRWHATRERREQ